ncbi:P-loop ATPase, Sll1717 family [Shewanella scandinavica]|uniref:P-loop ATPase, Sll1717 family n=1 Tax=Shewanella scandinavica TaxID=3063538 RepID=UPI00319D560B
MILEEFDFGNEAGDDVPPEELSAYFVEQSMFKKFTNQSNRLCVATAKKGVGKSALLQWLKISLPKKHPDDLVIKVRGSEVTRDAFKLINTLENPNDYIRDWMIRLCALVNREIAKTIDFAITDDQITIIESAELDGFKSKNLVGCLISRFEDILGKGKPKKQGIIDQLEILKRLDNPQVWILIDDLDATFQNTDKECLSLSTFFSACRYILQDISGINIRITMRSDVWPTIRRYDESLDKLEQYVEEISWSEKDFRKLLYRRIEAQSKEIPFELPDKTSYFTDEQYEEKVIALIFIPKVPWGDKEVYSYKVVHTLSYHRPRWAVQLSKLAQKNACYRRHEFITKEDIDDVWGEYGSKRIADLVAEHKHQCKNVEELVNGFRGEDRLMNRDELFICINNKIMNHMSVFIDDSKATSPREVARFLYRIGFLVARSEDDSGYHHYNYSDMPDLLSSRTSTDFSMKWEIHPCYRQALDIKKINRSQRKKRGLIS